MLIKLFACVILIWTIIHQDACEYVLSSRPVTWSEAASSHANVFATPNVSSSHHLINLLEDKEEVWVGYFQRNTAFAYLGCASIDVQANFSMNPIQINTPGLCFQLCKGTGMTFKIIGLSLGKCFCMTHESSSGDIKTGCVPNNSEWLAGDGVSLMSLYEKKELLSDVISDRNCFAFDKRNATAWQTCNQVTKSVCKTQDGLFIKVGQEWHLSWAKYILECFIKKCHPITYEDVKKKPEQLYELAESFTWTRLIRSMSVYRHNEFNNKMNIKYGYLKRLGSYVNLEFTINGNAAKRALYRTSDVLESSSDKTTSISSTISTGTTFNRDSASTEVSPETTPKTKETKDSTFGVPVGISVTVVIIVVAVIVIIVALQRRGIIQTKCFRKAEPECSAYTSTEIYSGSKNDNNAYEMSLCSPYDQIDDIGLPSERCSNNEGTDNGISGHTYLILGKHTWESNTDDNIENRTKTESNVYNTLHSNGNKTGSNESGNTYATTEKVAMKLKAQHNKNVGDDATENTYNTCSRPVKVGKTDNVYGILYNVEGQFDDVDTRNVRSKSKGEDTYSHIMKKY